MLTRYVNLYCITFHLTVNFYLSTLQNDWSVGVGPRFLTPPWVFKGARNKTTLNSSNIE